MGTTFFSITNLLILSFFLVGCAAVQDTDSPDANIGSAASSFPTVDNKVEIDETILSEQGMSPVVVQDDSIGQQKIGKRRLQLRRGTRLVGVVDTECSELNQRGLSKEIQGAAGDKRHLRFQAYSFQLNADTELDDLSQQADEDSCVLQVGNDVDLYAIATPNDPSYSRQWHMSSIEAAVAFDTFYQATSGIKSDVVVAIVDTGIDYNHSDLKDNMWTNASGSFGYDYINKDSDPMDDHGHGTHVAGIAGAVRGNGVGISGVMGSHIKLMAVKVLSASGSGSTSAVINGINYAVENGAQVINMSLGVKGTSSTLRTAMSNAVAKGTVVVVAAGNDGTQMTSTNFFSPASYTKDIKGALAVGSLTSSGARSSFSNYSSEYVEIAAPGSSLYSTYKGNSYATMSGTSMASPVVAGTAALTIGLLKSRGVTVTPALVEQLLTQGSLKSSSLSTSFADGNSVNLRLLAQAIVQYSPGPGSATPTPTPAPSPNPTPTPTPNPTPTPTPPANNTECGSITGVACEVLKGINAQRRANGLSNLKPLTSCQNMAQSHAEDMAMNNFFSHTSPTQGSFTQRARTFGVTGGSYGENIAMGYTATSVVTGWMNSSGHRANILNSSFRSTGVGYKKDSKGRPYYVQCFSSKSGG